MTDPGRAKRWLRERLPRSNLVRSAARLSSASIGASLVAIVAAPLLTRLYSVEDFGALAIYGALLAWSLTFASFKFETALPLTDSPTEKVSLFYVALLLTLGTSLVLLLAVAAFRNEAAQALDAAALRDLLWLLPLGVMLANTFMVARYLAVSRGDFRSVSRATLSQAGLGTAVQVVAYPLGAPGLVLGAIVARSAGSTRLLLLQRVFLSESGRGLRTKDLTSALRRNLNLAGSATTAAFTGSAAVILVPVLVSSAFGVAAAGLYGLMMRVLTLPIQHIGAAVADVFYADAQRRRDVGTLGALAGRVNSILIGMAVPPAMFVALWGQQLFALTFGEAWRTAGILAQIAVPWLLMQFVSSPISRMVYVLGAHRWNVAWQVSSLIIRLPVWVIGPVLGLDLVQTFAIFSALSTVMYAILMIRLLHLSGASVQTSLRSGVKATVVALGCNVTYLIAVFAGDGWIPLMLTAMALSGVAAIGSARKVLRAA